MNSEHKNVCSTSMALLALLSREFLPLSLEPELLKLLGNACEVNFFSAVHVGAFRDAF